MTLDEIIRNLEDQARDRDSSIDKDDPECIFRTDAKALREAVGLLAELAEYRKTGLTAEEFDKETDMLRETAIHAVYEAAVKGGVGLEQFSAIKDILNQQFENYRANIRNPRRGKAAPKTDIKELLDFCAEREVEIYTRYDFICDGLIVKMRKKDIETDTVISREGAASAGFWLTIRFILRQMAAELNKGAQA